MQDVALVKQRVGVAEARDELLGRELPVQVLQVAAVRVGFGGVERGGRVAALDGRVLLPDAEREQRHGTRVRRARVDAAPVPNHHHLTRLRALRVHVAVHLRHAPVRVGQQHRRPARRRLARLLQLISCVHRVPTVLVRLQRPPHHLQVRLALQVVQLILPSLI